MNRTKGVAALLGSALVGAVFAGAVLWGVGFADTAQDADVPGAVVELGLPAAQQPAGAVEYVPPQIAPQRIPAPSVAPAAGNASGGTQGLTGPRLYLPLTTPDKALEGHPAVPYPERALADLALAIQRKDASAIRSLTSAKGLELLLLGREGPFRLFGATSGWLVIDGHATTVTGDQLVLFTFVLPTPSGEQEFPGVARVMRSSKTGWYVDDVFQGEPVSQ